MNFDLNTKEFRCRLIANHIKAFADLHADTMPRAIEAICVKTNISFNLMARILSGRKISKACIEILLLKGIIPYELRAEYNKEYRAWRAWKQNKIREQNRAIDPQVKRGRGRPRVHHQIGPDSETEVPINK
jgi:hypothetical protein